MRELAKTLGIADVVTFAGHVPHVRVLEAMGSGEIHCVALASIVDSMQRDEGVPIALVEAMTFGLPALATDTGSIAELLPARSGLTVPMRDAEALAAGIAVLMDDEDRYAQASRFCRRRSRRYWSAAANSTRLLRAMQRVSVKAAP
jgi:glycosyltransferase involved in cell wall biosynthesis